MKHLSTTARRVATVIAAASLTGLIAATRLRGQLVRHDARR